MFLVRHRERNIYFSFVAASTGRVIINAYFYNSAAHYSKLDVASKLWPTKLNDRPNDHLTKRTIILLCCSTSLLVDAPKIPTMN